ncbi:MAG: nucleotidyl transferase AbiEii/AbiGii toxin family protein [Propionibacteriaceae bacterium]|nr:nucleotidyl transferase AbiEii/AbiGii toxin family protein [Propionibacteriaceae bacterium]
MAGKTVAILHRTTANTRWRDFADTYRLIGSHAVDGDDMAAAAQAVAACRNVELGPLGPALEGYAEAAQTSWAQRHSKRDHRNVLPGQFSDTLTALRAFADPVFTGQPVGRSWRAADREWS